MKIQDYSDVVISSILIKENKFVLVANSIKLIPDNYLYIDQFYEFLEFNKSGRIWNGTIEFHFTF